MRVCDEMDAGQDRAYAAAAPTLGLALAEQHAKRLALVRNQSELDAAGRPECPGFIDEAGEGLPAGSPRSAFPARLGEIDAGVEPDASGVSRPSGAEPRLAEQHQRRPRQNVGFDVGAADRSSLALDH